MEQRGNDSLRKEPCMAAGDKDRGEGAWDKAKGKVKGAIGELTEDRQKQAEGNLDKAKGELKEKKGEIKNDLDEKLHKT